MLRKVFLQTQFGNPHEWTAEYIRHVAKLEKYGWYWKIFTPNVVESTSNVEVVQMTIHDFDDRISKYCGVRPDNFINSSGLPAKYVSDYYPAYGEIFKDYTHGFDFWGHTNWDMVYGRLDHYIPDNLLENFDIWSDDVNTINGIFCLYKNTTYVRNLFRGVPYWDRMFVEPQLFGFDEVYMTKTVRELAAAGAIKFGGPPYFGYHSYDRLVQHIPSPMLQETEDGTLLEIFKDPLMEMLPDNILFQRGCFGREIMAFHFIQTKRWPL